MPAPMPVVRLAAQVAYVDAANDTAFFVDPVVASLAPRLVRVGHDPVLAQGRPGVDELLVLCRGERAPGKPPQAPALYALPADPAKPTRVYPLASRFDRVALSPDGRFALVHFGPDALAGNALVQNPNEIAIVDLDAAPGMGPTGARTLRSFGGVPEAVIFSPALGLRTEPPRALRLAVVVSVNYVTLVDLENDRSEITVALTRADEKRNVRTAQALFDASDPAQDPQIFLRNQNEADVVALRLAPVAPPLGDRANDFRPVLSLLGAGAAVADLALFAGSEGARLLAVSANSNDASVIDPRTSRVVGFKLDAVAERIVLFDGASPAEPQTRTRALLLGRGGAEVGFLDLDRLEDLRGRSLERRPMSGAASSFLPLVDRGRVLALHKVRAGSVGLSVIDLEKRTIAPLVTDTLADLTSGFAPSEDVWLVPEARNRLGLLRLGRLTSDEVRLDLPIGAVLPMLPARDGKRYLVVDHTSERGSSGGALTVLDADQPSRATARSLVGFLLDNYLDRGGAR